MEEAEKSSDCESVQIQRQSQTEANSNDADIVQERQTNHADMGNVETQRAQNSGHVWTPKEIGKILRKLGDNLEMRANGETSSRAEKKG